MYDNIFQTSSGNPQQSTSGLGGFMGPGMDVWAAWPNTVASVTATGYTANRVIAVAFYLARPVTINHASISMPTQAGTTATGNAGIYNASGQLLVDTGSFNLNPGSTGVFTRAAAVFNTGGGITLPAGTYFYAWAMTVTATVALTGMAGPGTSQAGLVNAVTVQMGLSGAGNVLSGGALPATLGTLTGGDISVPCAFFCP